MRAREADQDGYAVSGGVRLHWEIHGEVHGAIHGEVHGATTVFLLPTWPALDARVWKLQVPYLARHVRVVVADPRGNGRSDRPAHPAAYSDAVLVEDAVAVLDATGTDRAVCVGLSMGGRVLLQLAASHPERVAGAVFLAPSVRVEDEAPTCWPTAFERPFAGGAGWGRYNAEFWRRDLAGFARWFFGEVFCEPHSTKQVDDAVAWMLQTDAETMIAIERARTLDGVGPRATDLARRVSCPALVVSGDDDRIVPLGISRAVADALGCPLEVVAGGGHCVHARHPVWFNHRLRRFAEEVAAGARA